MFAYGTDYALRYSILYCIDNISKDPATAYYMWLQPEILHYRWLEMLENGIYLLYGIARLLLLHLLIVCEEVASTAAVDTILCLISDMNPCKDSEWEARMLVLSRETIPWEDGEQLKDSHPRKEYP